MAGGFSEKLEFGGINIMQTIHQHIIKDILNYLEPFKNDYAEQRFEFKITDGWSSDDIYQVEIHGYHKNDYEPEKQTTFILLRLFINYEHKQIHISNIFLPDFMKHKCLGKKLIYKIFTISEKEQYGLFIVDMVNSFYQKMIKRGALPCDNCDDAVQIVSETKLF